MSITSQQNKTYSQRPNTKQVNSKSHLKPQYFSLVCASQLLLYWLSHSEGRKSLKNREHGDIRYLSLSSWIYCICVFPRLPLLKIYYMNMYWDANPHSADGFRFSHINAVGSARPNFKVNNNLSSTWWYRTRLRFVL